VRRAGGIQAALILRAFCMKAIVFERFGEPAAVLQLRDVGRA
jgi:hypothetical protein